ncbi:MAG: hypothetical protein KBS59_05865, partial [Clostridiales bacterium]|nr:hypothetical protein [Clostridiales bacterium]
YHQLYTINVIGNYDPTPDLGPTKLQKQTNLLFGTLPVYTAGLPSDGQIYFNTAVDKIEDTSATLLFTMQPQSYQELLQLIGEFRISVTNDKTEEEVYSYKFTKEDFSKTFEYSTKEAAFVISEGNAASPRILLYGTEDKILDTAWDSFCVQKVIPETDPQTGEVIGSEYSSPMQLQIVFPKKTFTNNTKYSFSIIPYVTKTKDYKISCKMTTTSFTTKKIIPYPKYDKFFLAADVAEFQNFRLVDPDGTIVGGNVSYTLYYGLTPLKTGNITAVKNENDAGDKISFDGLMADCTYTLQFIAPTYNNGGYQFDYPVYTETFTVGEKLSGKLSVESLSASTGTAKISVKVYDKDGYLKDESATPFVTLTLMRSTNMINPNYKDYKEPEILNIPLPESGNTLELDMIKEYTDLPQNDAYKAILTAKLGGTPIVLDEIEFRTNADYVSVATHK